VEEANRNHEGAGKRGKMGVDNGKNGANKETSLSSHDFWGEGQQKCGKWEGDRPTY